MTTTEAKLQQTSNMPRPEYRERPAITTVTTDNAIFWSSIIVRKLDKSIGLLKNLSYAARIDFIRDWLKEKNIKAAPVQPTEETAANLTYYLNGN